MKSKILKVVIDVVLSIVFFFITSILLAWAGGAIFGTVKGADGQNYGNYNSGILIAIAFILTIAFAIFFYKMLSKKSNKIEE